MSDSTPVPLQVWCLCAAWCRNCDEYRPTFDAALAALGDAAHGAWIDIEDDAELVGEVDVDDFPTLLIARAGRPVFLGPLTPQPAVLARLLRGALDGALPPIDDAVAAGFVARATGAAP
ncbi:MAG: thioredoxin domain-containing protein [Rubrivivax sp.]